MTPSYVLVGMPPTVRYPGVQRDPDWGVQVYTAPQGRTGLPSALKEYAAPPHTFERRVQDILNRTAPQPFGERELPPLRDEQKRQVARIKAAYDQEAPGYLLALPPGSGKTVMAIRAACATGAREVLVITKKAIVSQWCREIDKWGTGDTRFTVINTDRTWKLLALPAGFDPSRMIAHQIATTVARTGENRLDWDFVIHDESHQAAHPSARRARTVDRIIGNREEFPTFALYMSATPMSDPDETYYLSRLIAWAGGTNPPEGPGEYRQWLLALGLRLRKSSKNRWHHDVNMLDVTILTRLLYESGLGAAATTQDMGLPSQQRHLVPIDLSDDDLDQYQLAWRDFLAAHGTKTLPAAAPESFQAAALRQIQKASLVKTPYVARFVVEQVRKGEQVVCAGRFIDSIDQLAVAVTRLLRAQGMSDKVVTITGRNADDRAERVAMFQTGAATVCLTNSLEGVNLHAGEENCDGRGTRATDTPRHLVMIDVLTGGKLAFQAEGRTQRNGTEAPVSYLYARDTLEVAWLAVAFRRLADTSSLRRSKADQQDFLRMAEELEKEAEDDA